MYSSQLSFLQQLLKNMHISCCIVADPEQSIDPSIDLQLRAQLYGLENYSGFLQNSMLSARARTVYRFYDEYDCHYIFLRLPEQGHFLFIGPYLLSIPDKAAMARKDLTKEQLHRLQQHYYALPLIEDENLLLIMANTFAGHLWGEDFSMEHVDFPIPDRYEPIAFHATPRQNSESELAALERNYANENLLMEAVSKGKLHKVTAMASTVYTNGAEQRLADSIRDRKNYLIILKTLLRKAAEKGGVHPLHIHGVSAHYADRIENIRTIKQSLTLQEDMIRSFCKLVKNHSLNKYSYYVGQAITIVQYDLTADLRLQTIADKLSVNSSYLSSLFHREYGCTLTEFVNRQRIEHGLQLLRTTDKPVQQIAGECGIHDVNYFIKLFKKQTGFTPNGYRRKEGRT